MPEDSRVLVQNEITRLINTCQFFQVEYDADTDLAETLDTEEVPQSVFVNETGTRFGRSRFGRSVRNEPTEWSMLAKVTFGVEVAYFSSVQEVFLDKVPSISLDKLYHINLKSIEHKHPPRVGSSTSGTVILFTFSVDPVS